VKGRASSHRRLLIGLPILLLGAPAFTEDWPMWGGNPARTGVANSGLKPPFVVKWVFNRPNGPSWGTSPVIEGSTLYQSDRQLIPPNKIWAVDAKDGTFLWSRTIDTHEIALLQALNQKLFYQLCKGGTLGQNQLVESYDGALQTVRWTASETFGPLPYASGPTVYVRDYKTLVYAIDDATGSVKWTLTVPGDNQIQGCIAEADGVLYAPSDPVAAFVDQGASAILKWQKTDPSCNTPLMPAVTHDKVYAACSGVYAYDLDGTLKWTYPVGANVCVILVVFASGGKYLYALRDLDSSASLLWKTDVGYDTFGCGKPVIANGYVYINGKDAASENAVVAVNISTGKAEWTYGFTGTLLKNSPAMAHNLLYVSPYNYIYCFGKPLNLSLAVDKASASPADILTYTLTVNSYNGPSTNITLVATLPAQLNYQSSSDGGALVGNMVVWNNLPITADTIKTITFTAQVDPGLQGGTYDLIVQAFLDYAGNPPDLTECLSEKAHTLVQLPKPSPPANLSAIQLGAAINLSWAMAISGVDPISGYNLYRATYSGLAASPGTYLIQTLGIAASAYSDPSVVPGITYCYLVRAVDVKGVESISSNEACALVKAPPNPPTSLTATPLTSTIAVVWTPSITGPEPVTGYRLYRATYPGFIIIPSRLIALVPGSTSSLYTDSNVVPGVTYCYRLRALGANGLESTDSNEDCAIIPPSFAPYRGPLRVFPNPFNPDKAVRGTLKFEGLPIGSKVRIYTPRGLKVWEGEVVTPYLVEWDGKNDGRKRVAPGAYMWVAESDEGKTKGTLIVE